MAYFAPFIDAAGLHIPQYSDIESYELQQFLLTYGQTIDQGNDSADIQWISIFSLMINDAFNTAQLAINSRSPLTAVGGDLDSIVGINGISRKVASFSTAVLVISGTAGTIINNGVAQDTNNYLWDLPLTLTIPNTGSIAVTAICETVGAITALAGTINVISTPTQGWISVSNPAAAAPGEPTESDSQLRGRQQISVAISSKTLVDGTLAAIAAVPNVTRYNPGIASPTGQSTSIENPTGGVDYFGNPAHSISMVVEGGTDIAVATAIYNNKTPGCLTNGTTTILVTDPVSLASMNISFFRPTYVQIYVSLSVHGLTGYTSAVTALIQNALFNYLNSLEIGESLTVSALYAVALSVTPNLSLPQFSVQALTVGTAPSPTGTTDIPILFNQVTQGVLANIIITNV